jgi:hypothetical protein
MSASAQEVKSQIAEMREALRSARASQRTRRVVGILGVLVGLGIVALFVWLFFSLGKGVLTSQEFRAKLQDRLQMEVNQMNLQSKLRTVAQEAAPAYLEEAQKVLRDMNLEEVAGEQFQLMVEELRPVLEAELQGARPRLAEMVVQERDLLMNDLQEMIERTVGGRLTEMVGQQSQRLVAETGVDDQTLTNVVGTLRDASLNAFRDMVEERAGDLEEEMNLANEALVQIPPLPEGQREEVPLQLRNVLLNLLKLELPEYEFTGPLAPGIPARAAAPRRVVTPKVEMPPEARKARQEALERARKAREEAQKARQEAEGGAQ